MFVCHPICSDFNVKVVTIADGSQRLLKGHTAPVLSVTIDPKDQYIVSITLRGFHKKQFIVLNILVTNKLIFLYVSFWSVLPFTPMIKLLNFHSQSVSMRTAIVVVTRG